MKVMDYYIQLRLHDPEKQYMQNSLQELANILYCSTKNVKILLRKMNEEKLITWTPGRGRGNKSEVLFLHAISEVVMPYAESLLQQDKLKEIFLLLKQPFPAPLRKSLEEKLQQHFGYQPLNDMYDVLKIPCSRKILPLDPAFAAVTTESHLISQIFDTLVTYNYVTEEIEPHLAHTWEISDDQLTWTFYLRKGIQFHHGTILSSKDVQFSFERLQRVQSPYTWLTEEIVQIETPSPLQISFHLRKPNLFFLHYVSSMQLAILPHDVTIQNHHYMGTGPFKLHSYYEDQVVLEAFTNYFKERALLDRIELWRIPEHAQIHTHYELPNTEHTKEHEVQIEETGCIYAAFNFTKPGPHHDIYFRKAWRQLYDVESIIRDLQGMRTIPAFSFFPERSRIAEKQSYSLHKAKSYLQKSAYQGETIHIYFFSFKDSAHDAIWLKERCHNLGIQVELHPFPVSDYSDDSIDQNADIILMGEVFNSDIEIAFLNVFKSKSCFINRFMYPHYQKQIDCLLNTFLAEENKEHRYKLIYGIKEFLRTEYIILFNYHVLKKKIYPSSLKNVTIDSFGWTDFSKLWIHPTESAKEY
ncbi:SgrR family transcriptional regulator [Bacillus pseudomycoides]|uniref:SgrR family transcriptional regulator n=1 Tax=Bacillus pseudomycoides TaxID=64104 RepID=UPI000BFBF323|nr:SgrR family transcriptional regulator [Bacillus pseudomycoides]PHE37110.1 SgrR family transcriptional regulator [Bacillus pseudomycoides]